MIHLYIMDFVWFWVMGNVLVILLRRNTLMTLEHKEYVLHFGLVSCMLFLSGYKALIFFAFATQQFVKGLLT